jgi:hypothetical protein
MEQVNTRESGNSINIDLASARQRSDRAAG